MAVEMKGRNLSIIWAYSGTAGSQENVVILYMVKSNASTSEQVALDCMTVSPVLEAPPLPFTRYSATWETISIH